jgi:hypothetical protein
LLACAKHYVAYGGAEGGRDYNVVDVSEQTLRNWIRQGDLDDGRRTDGLTSSEQQELRRLRREVAELRMERELLVKAVAAHTDQPWVVLYVRRWLAAPIQHPDGSLQQRDRGTPQGSAVSPVLANLFMHYAFDAWMARRFPAIQFERYADDAVVHCVSQRQARMLVRAIADRMAEVGLRLHPAKTRIVYCKDGKRQLDYEHTAFTFLGFTFRARGARGARGERFTSFLPAISKDALGKLSAEVRRWRLHRWTGLSLTDVAQRINLIVRGWMQYYGAFYRTALYPLLQRINTYLMRWLRKKHKRLRPMRKAKVAWRRITSQDPRLFAHWAWAPASWWSR